MKIVYTAADIELIKKTIITVARDCPDSFPNFNFNEVAESVYCFDGKSVTALAAMFDPKHILITMSLEGDIVIEMSTELMAKSLELVEDFYELAFDIYSILTPISRLLKKCMKKMENATKHISQMVTVKSE